MLETTYSESGHAITCPRRHDMLVTRLPVPEGLSAYRPHNYKTYAVVYTTRWSLPYTSPLPPPAWGATKPFKPIFPSPWATGLYEDLMRQNKEKGAYSTRSTTVPNSRAPLGALQVGGQSGSGDKAVMMVPIEEPPQPQNPTPTPLN
ncbi:hypothetical protein J6590_043531 [Homalodisca vitripennis]|nr:hypothetical protein J6590_043531 [Homalodisca vitripennis]